MSIEHILIPKAKYEKLMDKYNASLKQDSDPSGNNGYKTVKNQEKHYSEPEIINKTDLSLREINKSIDTESEDNDETVGTRTLEDIISSHEKFLPPGQPAERTSTRKHVKNKRKPRPVPYSLISRKWVTL